MAQVKKECSISVDAFPNAHTPTVHISGLQSDILIAFASLAETLVLTGVSDFKSLHHLLRCSEVDFYNGTDYCKNT